MSAPGTSQFQQPTPPPTPTIPTEPSLMTAKTQADLVSKVEFFHHMLSLQRNLEYVVFVGSDPVASATWKQQMNPQVEGMILTEYPLPPVHEHCTPKQFDQYEKDLKVFLHNYIASKGYTDIPMSSHLLAFKKTKEATPQIHIFLTKGRRVRDSFFRDWIAHVRKGKPQPGETYHVRELRSRLSTVSEEAESPPESGNEAERAEGAVLEPVAAKRALQRQRPMSRSDSGSSAKESSDLECEPEASDKMDVEGPVAAKKARPHQQPMSRSDSGGSAIDNSDLDYETESSDKMEDDGMFEEEQASGARSSQQ